jgi:hypothetical protein
MPIDGCVLARPVHQQTPKFIHDTSFPSLPADEVAQAAGRREQLYELQPAGPAASSRAEACPARTPAGGIDTLSAALSGVRLKVGAMTG